MRDLMSRYYNHWDTRKRYRNKQYSKRDGLIAVVIGAIFIVTLFFIYNGGGFQFVNPILSQSPPSNIAVTVQVEKDPVYHTINALFSGGKGQVVTDYCIVKVTRSDGRVITEQIQPIKLAEVKIQGTEKSDRVEVFVVYQSGRVYKIFDKSMPNRKYYDEGV